MEFNKYLIKKKWWQYSKFQVFDQEGDFVFRSEEIGFLNTRMELINSSGATFLVMKPSSAMSYNYDFKVNDDQVASFQRNWSSSKFTINYKSSPPILLQLNFWNGDIVIDSDGKQIGRGSAKNYYSNVGVAISAEYDPTYILAGIIIICSLKAKGYS